MVLAGTSSGVGKTSIAAAIIHGMRKRGYSVQPFKVGPDFIDPTYLAAVARRPARNLDPWLMGRSGVARDFVQNSGADVSVIEGVMGYYDGLAGDSNFASTYHVSRIVRAPVVLAIDASRAARSVAATALGFARFGRQSGIRGVILNKIGSRRHEELCRRALEGVGLDVLGVIPRDSSEVLESRHLGLIPVGEVGSLGAKIRRIAREYSEHIDIDKIVKLASGAPPLAQAPRRPAARRRARIAVALDESFNFYYRENIDSLRREGAALEFFSPIHDRKMPRCDGIYIGGGFPEVKGEALERNGRMMGEICRMAGEGTPIYAECGGLMYLTRSIRYGMRKFRMAGLFDADTVMGRGLKLNYTKAAVSRDCAVSPAGAVLHGHEFHLSELESVSGDSRFAYRMEMGVGIGGRRDGLVQYNVLASYMHMHFAVPKVARRFVESCTTHSRG